MSRRAALVASTALTSLGASTSTYAADFSALSLERIHESQGLVGVSVFVALVLFSTSTALLHLTGRKRWALREAQLVSDLTSTRAALDRAQVFLSAEPQIVVAWGTSSGEPDIEGDLSLVMDAPMPRRVLGFGSWLPPEQAKQLESQVERLRGRGEGFRMALVSIGGRHLEVEGRAVAGRAVLRIRDVSGDRLELTKLRERHARTLSELDSLHTMLNAIPQPVWLRDLDGKLTWVNNAYARAVEVNDPREAVARSIELLDRPAREAASQAHGAGTQWRARTTAVVSGQRHLLEIVDVASPAGSTGFANDLDELERTRIDLGRQMEAHARTLDQLTTAVAIFDRAKRLVFHNAAYRHLWNLETSFLDQRPTDSEILDRLRAERKLPEQADFRSWKAGLMDAYQSVDTIEQVWYLPDGRTLRTVTNPNPQGGLTYLFDDVTERFHLESRYNELIRVQGETLDTLKEGVAVFGGDGRLRLFNTAFADLWALDMQMLHDRPHVDDVVRICASLCAGSESLTQLRSVVVGLHDARTTYQTRLTRIDDKIFDCAAAPLPDGSTLITFTDVTAGVNVERALTERNQALLDAENLRNDFVHHVSYELRSPLTNIIGFIQLLAEGAVGPLNDKQREYTGYVLKSSAALLAIINDILDLASIDRDAMELTLEDVDVARTIQAAADGLQDRVAEMQINLQIVITDNVGRFRADSKRIRQVLFNLLSNAIGFSSPGQTVTLAALRRGDDVIFKVSDQGRGIPPELLDHVFDRFQTNTVGTRHRGVGLGLSIVRAFVELHGGRVQIESAPGEGTVVTCIFPAKGEAKKTSVVA
jgi:signal transduction histidine kinase